MATEVRELQEPRLPCRSNLGAAGPCVWLSHFLVSTFPISISDFLFPRSPFYNYPDLKACMHVGTFHPLQSNMLGQELEGLPARFKQLDFTAK